MYLVLVIGVSIQFYRDVSERKCVTVKDMRRDRDDATSDCKDSSLPTAS